MLDELEKYFKKIQIGLVGLQKDIGNMAAADHTNKAEAIKAGKPIPKPSLSALHPMVRVRKNMQEIKNANDNPQITLIEDKLKDIFK
jgi:hypothetical protein